MIQKIKNTIEYNLSYEQYKDKDIYYYKVSSNSLLFNGFSGFTNKEGIDKLIDGKRNIDSFNYTLGIKDNIENFRKMNFYDAYDILNKMKINISNLNNENYELFRVEGNSHSIFDIDGNLLPKFLNLNKPLYLINNQYFDLNEVLDIVSNDERFIANKHDSRYEKIENSKNGFNITNIPYYNSEESRNKYLNIGFIPNNDDWDKLINIAKENNLIDKSGHIRDLEVLAIKLGIIPLEFKNENEYGFLIEDLIIPKENDFSFN